MASAIAAPPLYHWYVSSVMFMPSSSETPVASAVRVWPSVRVPVIARSPEGASLTSVTLTVMTCEALSWTGLALLVAAVGGLTPVEASTVRAMVGEVSWSKLAVSLTVISHVVAFTSKFPLSSPVTIAQFAVVSFIPVGDQTLVLAATSSVIAAVLDP